MPGRVSGRAYEGDFSLPKTRLLTKSWEYERVYRQGKRLRGSCFSLIFAPNDGLESRLGISVHGVRKAVQRNRIKRIIREFFRLNRGLLPQAQDIIFAVRKGFAFDSPEAVRKSVRQLLEKKPSKARSRSDKKLSPVLTPGHKTD